MGGAKTEIYENWRSGFVYSGIARGRFKCVGDRHYWKRRYENHVRRYEYSIFHTKYFQSVFFYRCLYATWRFAGARAGRCGTDRGTFQRICPFGSEKGRKTAESDGEYRSDHGDID